VVSMHATRETICEGQLWHSINTVVSVFIGFVMELRFQTQPRKSSALRAFEKMHPSHFQGSGLRAAGGGESDLRPRRLSIVVGSGLTIFSDQPCLHVTNSIVPQPSATSFTDRSAFSAFPSGSPLPYG
jgi:hypothetical protein